MDSNYKVSGISPQTHPLTPAKTSEKGQMSGHDISLNKISQEVKTIETTVNTAFNNMSKVDFAKIELTDKKLTEIKSELENSALPQDKKDELLATIGKIQDAVFLILLQKEESRPKPPELRPLSSNSTSKTPTIARGPRQKPETPRGKLVNLLRNTSSLIESLAKLPNDKKEKEINLIRLTLNVCKDDLNELITEGKITKDDANSIETNIKEYEKKLEKFEEKPSSSATPQRPPLLRQEGKRNLFAGTSQSQSTPQAKPQTWVKAQPAQGATPLQPTTLAASQRSPLPKEMLSKMVPDERNITPEKKGELEQGVRISASSLLNTYTQFTNSEELFQAINLCMEDKTIGIDQKLAILKFTKDWITSGFHDNELNIVQNELDKLIGNCMKSANPSIKSAGLSLNRALQEAAMKEKKEARSLDKLVTESKNKIALALPKSITSGMSEILRNIKSGKINYKTAVDNVAQDLFIAFASFRVSTHPNEYYADLNKRESQETAPHLHEEVKLFNQMNNFILAEILKAGNPDEQGNKKNMKAMVKLFLDVAEKAYENGNLPALNSIMGALNNTAISRLLKELDLDKTDIKRFSKFTDLVNVTGAYKNMRAYIQERKNQGKPCISPGVMISKDMTFIKDGNPDKVGNKPNIHKLNLYNKTISDYNKETINLKDVAKKPLNTSLLFNINNHTIVNSNDLYEISLKIKKRPEPKKTKAK